MMLAPLGVGPTRTCTDGDLRTLTALQIPRRAFSAYLPADLRTSSIFTAKARPMAICMVAMQ